ncbi:MAG: hypothetical protein EOP09_17315 [Proteobacteria bacterium]|nr:MAG: hypothetical protein EOP09_17315 [Pseudomonadota bacterium]
MLIRFTALTALTLSQFAGAADVDFTNPIKPGLLTGQADSFVSFTVSRSTTIGESLESSDPRLPGLGALKLSTLTEVYRLNHSHSFYPDFQAGFSLPLVSRKKTNDAFSDKITSVGDFSTFMAYRLAREDRYRPFVPAVHLYGELSLPTGAKIFDPSTGLIGDSTSPGAFDTTAGLLIKKTAIDWDVFAVSELGHGLSRHSLSELGIPTETSSALHALYALGGGYRMKEWPLRLGASLQYKFQGSRVSENERVGSAKIPTKRSYAVVLGAQAQMNRDLLASLDLSDDSLLGAFDQPTLQRRVSLSLSYQWLK